MTKYILKRGFTLIELLVVIAIIGILAAVVLASLNSARDKGADASIKSTLNNLRAQAELFYDDNSSTYNGFCATIDTASTSVSEAGGTLNCTGTSANMYHISSSLVSTTTVWYCADASGFAGEVSSDPTDAYQCP